MHSRVRLSVCRHLVAEFRAVTAGERYANVDVTPCRVSCDHPSDGAPHGPSTRVDEVALTCSFGGGPASDESPAQCFELLLDPKEVSRLEESGAYLATPGWLTRCRAELCGTGAAEGEPSGLQAIIGECANRIVWLDAGLDAEAPQVAEECARLLGLPCERYPISLERLGRIVAEKVGAHRMSLAETRLSHENRRVADYAMALELFRDLSGLESEVLTIRKIVAIFAALFAPESVQYTRVVGNELKETIPEGEGPPEAARMALENEYAWDAAHDGFILRIGQPGHAVGVVTLRRFPFPQYADHYLGLARSLSELCAMAISAARKQEEKRALEAQLRQAVRMEAVGLLAGGIAHDFNNLLTGIRGYAELIRMDPSDAASVLDDLGEIILATERGASMTQRLLSFARKQAVVRRAVDLCEHVTHASRLLSRVIREDIELRVRAEAGPCYVWIDPVELDQILINLVINARDAMPSGGTIFISAKGLRASSLSLASGSKVPHTVSDGRAQVSLNYAARSELDPSQLASRDPVVGWGRLSVADTGAGMDVATLARVFEPFFTTKGSGHGTGLGLPIVEGIVRDVRGLLSIRSAPAVGTTFELFFPEVDDPTEFRPAPRAVASVGGSETILLVEDDAVAHRIVNRALTMRGYRVLGAHDGVEATELSAREPGPIHLVLTDLVMPRRNGRELTEILRALRPGIRVVLMTGYAGSILNAEPDEAGELMLLQKPFELADLLATVRMVLDRPVRG